MIENSKIQLAIIDDEADFLEMSKVFLKRINKNYKMKLFTSPSKFLNYIEHSHYQFDCIISDYEMPEMNGLILLSKLQSIKVLIPFIIVTGKCREEIIIEALNNGVEFYLQKSADIESMYKELNYFIEKIVEKTNLKIQLKELKELYKILVDLTPEGILIHINRVIRFANQALLRMLSYQSEQDLIGKSVFEILHEDYHPFLQERMKAIESGVITPFVKAKLLKSDGTAFEIEGTGRTIQYLGQPAIIVFIRAIEDYLEFG